MTTHQIDTSGWVLMRGVEFPANMQTFSDLSPFTQGFIEAALEDFQRHNLRGIGWRADCPKCVGSKFCCDEHNRAVSFSDLAPETLARLIEDCAELADLISVFNTPSAERGREAWIARSENFYVRFPPLTLYLNDAGKVAVR